MGDIPIRSTRLVALTAASSAAATLHPIGSFKRPTFVTSDPATTNGCSIIGGYVIRDQSVPDPYGCYVYSDYCTGELRSLVLPSANSGLATDDRASGLHVSKPTSFGEDSCGTSTSRRAKEPFTASKARRRPPALSPASC